MKKKTLLPLTLPCWAFLLLFLLFPGSAHSADSAAVQKAPLKVIGYFAGWSGKVDLQTFPAKKMTHINYAFAIIKDGKIAGKDKNDPENFILLNQLKMKNPLLNVLISIGGWTDSNLFSSMSATAQSRKVFIDSALIYMRANHLDGIDIDWEYPNLPGDNNPHAPADVGNFTALLRDFRTALDLVGKKDKRHYLLTIAAAAFPEYVANIEADKIGVYLDFINLMTYDFFGGWDAFTGHHASLFPSAADPKAVSTSLTVKMFKDAGIPSEKLVLGVPFYGHGWQEVTAAKNGRYQPGKALKGDFSFLSLVQLYIDKNGFTRYWDADAKVPYLWNDKTRQFITYEDPQSLTEKCRFIKKEGLGGAMFWEFHSDYQDQLLTTLFEELLKN